MAQLRVKGTGELTQLCFSLFFFFWSGFPQLDRGNHTLQPYCSTSALICVSVQELRGGKPGGRGNFSPWIVAAPSPGVEKRVSNCRKTRLLRDLDQLLWSRLSGAVNTPSTSPCLQSRCLPSACIFGTILGICKHRPDLLAYLHVYLEKKMFAPHPIPMKWCVETGGLGCTPRLLEGMNYLPLSTCGSSHQHRWVSGCGATY